MEDILFALWFFLPAGIANVTPIIAAKTPLISKWDAPVDFGLKLRGRPLLGPHKTIRGILFGTLAGTLVFVLQVKAYDSFGWAIDVSGGIDYSQLTIWLGVALSFGALFGDMAKSLFKRQLSVPSGKSWFPFDQLDYVFGGLLFSTLIISLETKQYFLIIALWFIIHPISTYIGYKLHFKKDPI